MVLYRKTSCLDIPMNSYRHLVSFSNIVWTPEYRHKILTDMLRNNVSKHKV